MHDEKSQEEEDDSERNSDNSDNKDESIKLDSKRWFSNSSCGGKVGNLTHDSFFSDCNYNTSSSTFFTKSTEKC